MRFQAWACAVCCGNAFGQIQGLATVGNTNFALGVSADGKVVVGRLISSQPFRWTRASGLIPFGSVGGSGGDPIAVSADGSVIVGLTAGFPFRWTQSTGVEFLETSQTGAATSVTADGGTIVGYLGSYLSPPRTPFIWTQSTGLRVLDTPGFTGDRWATAISGNGQVIAIQGGDFPTTGGIRLAGGVAESVPRIGPSGTPMWPTALNFDGSVMVGYAEYGGGGGILAAWRWVHGAPVQDIGVPGGNGANEAQALAVSADGGMVGGSGDQHHTVIGVTPFVWTAGGGMQNALDYFAANWIRVPAGSDIRTVTGVSGTGHVLVGTGTVTGYATGSYIGAACYANCDQSTVAPALNANDFQCFLNAFAAGSPIANCDGSFDPPQLNAGDFSCFLNAFVAGCD